MESIQDIAFLIDEGYLFISNICIGRKKDYFALIDSLPLNKESYLADGGGKNHVALKLFVGDYFKKIGVLKIEYEHLFYGYYPDVMSSDKTIIAECGHTQNPEKMLVYFQQGNIKECIQIPYPSYEDNYIREYSFTANDNLNEFLDFLENKRRNQLKDIFKKNRKINLL